MKKNMKYTLIALLAVFGLASCDKNDYEYSAPETVAGAQVYFPTTNATSFELKTLDGEFLIPVTRVDTTQALNANVSSSCTSDKYTVAEAVAFEANQKESMIKVSYSGLEYDVMDTLTITLDESVTTPYGGNKCVLLVGAPAPWVSLGEATFVDEAWCTLYGAPVITYMVEIQENQNIPGYYRLVSPWGENFPYNDPGDYDTSEDYYLYIHAEDPDFVYVLPQSTGVQWSAEDGVIWAGDFAGYYIARGNDPALVKDYGYGGKFADGIISWSNPKSWIVGFNGDMGYYGNNGGTLKIAMPGVVLADYSVEVEYNGIFTDAAGATSAVGTLTLGEDATNVKAIVMTQDDDAEAVADAIAAGDLEAIDVQAGRIEVPFNAEELESGKLQIIVAVLSEDGLENVASAKFEYFGGAGNPWKSLGIGLYTDDAVITSFLDQNKQPIPPITYEVEIMESTETPGLYRIMNPYSNSVYPYADGDCAEEGSYIEVNACDPEGVYIMKQSLGFDWGYGEFAIESLGGFYLTKYPFDTVKEAGYLGTVKDGIINFPVISYEDEGITYYVQGSIYFGNTAYDAGSNGKIQIVLPSAYDAGIKAQHINAKKNFNNKKVVAKKSHKMMGKQLLNTSMQVKNLKF